MRSSAFVTALSAGILLIAAADFARAQEIRIGPGGVTIVPPALPVPEVGEEPAPEFISRREAGEIALDQGMAEVRSVDRDGLRYLVRGEDQDGQRMRVTIDGR